jgi:hypothetical protein
VRCSPLRWPRVRWGAATLPAVAVVVRASIAMVVYGVFGISRGLKGVLLTCSAYPIRL